MVPFPDWNDLRDILLVSEAGSLSGAARRAGISQSTMSRRLAAIEASGQPVFHRDENGRLTANARGRALLEAAREMAAIHEAVKARLDAPAPTLQVASCGMMAQLFLHERIFEWASRSGIEVKLSVQDDLQPQDLEGHDLIVAPLAHAPECAVGLHLGRVQMALFAPQAQGAAPRPEELGVIQASRALAAQDCFRWLARQGGRVTLMSPDLPTMAEACARGLGVALLPAVLAGRDARLRPLEGPEAPPCDVWVVADARKADDPRVAGFMKWARGAFRAAQEGKAEAAGQADLD